jgi:hypothetical protein
MYRNMRATVTQRMHSGSTTNRRFSRGSNGNVTRINSEAMNPILPHNNIESASWTASQQTVYQDITAGFRR